MMIRLYTLSMALALLVCNGVQAAITGAVTSGAGELAIINSDREAAWSVSPADYMASYAVSDDGKTVYFASPKKGAVTFYAASVIDGLPAIESYTLYNGVEVPDDSNPTPAPAPKPAPAPETVTSIIKDATVDATPDDYNALANAFDAVVSGIDRGTIATPTGARETFRALWMQEAARTNPAAIGLFSGLLDKLSGMIDYTDLASVRKDFAAIVEALRAKADAKPAQAKKAASKKATTDKTKDKQEQICPGGVCPTGNCPNGQCPLQDNNYRYRWGW